MGSRSINLGLLVRGGDGLAAFHGSVTLRESAGSASSVSTEDVIYYINKFVCVSPLSSVEYSRVGLLMQEMPCSDGRAI